MPSLLCRDHFEHLHRLEWLRRLAFCHVLGNYSWTEDEHLWALLFGYHRRVAAHGGKLLLEQTVGVSAWNFAGVGQLINFQTQIIKLLYNCTRNALPLQHRDPYILPRDDDDRADSVAVAADGRVRGSDARDYSAGDKNDAVSASVSCGGSERRYPDGRHSSVCVWAVVRGRIYNCNCDNPTTSSVVR